MTSPKPAALSSKVRRIYEAQPYPSAEEGALTKPWLKLAPLEWIGALAWPEREAAPPRRILVAGCGAGSEAFSLRRRVPDAEIVAVDFSPRSIAVARRLAPLAPEMRDIRFVVADLASPRLAAKTGRGFDLITCHGVLSYVPEPERALRNLAHCLAPDGALYLGVNGATHHSVGWRQALPRFGFDLDSFADSPRLRELLRVCDAMCFHEHRGRIASQSAAYLASDLFGPLIHNLPLADWVRAADAAGLSLRGNHSGGRPLRMLCDKGLTRVLLPRSRAEVCELEELLLPGAFHRLLFTRQPPANPPWADPEALLGWRPLRTRLHETVLPAKGRSWHALRTVRCRSAVLNTQVELRIPGWEVELLRGSDGTRPLRELLQQTPVPVPAKLLREQLYLLYLLNVIDLLPPEPGKRKPTRSAPRSR